MLYILIFIAGLWIGIEINIWWTNKFADVEFEEGCLCHITPTKCDYCLDLEDENIFPKAEDIVVDYQLQNKTIDITCFSQSNFG